MNRDHFDIIIEGASFNSDTDTAFLEKLGLDVLYLDKDMRAGGKDMNFSRWVLGCYFMRH